MMNQKSFLFIFNRGPHSSLEAKEGMDFAFSCAAFEQKVDTLFRGEAVYQLLKGQDCSSLNLKNHSLGIEAFELYGIEHCYYEPESLNALAIDSAQLIDNALASELDLADLIKKYDFVVNY